MWWFAYIVYAESQRTDGFKWIAWFVVIIKDERENTSAAINQRFIISRIFIIIGTEYVTDVDGKIYISTYLRSYHFKVFAQNILLAGSSKNKVTVIVEYMQLYIYI